MMLLCSKYISMSFSKCNAKAQQDAFNVFQALHVINPEETKKQFQSGEKTARTEVNPNSSENNFCITKRSLSAPRPSRNMLQQFYQPPKNRLLTPTPAFSHALVMAPKLMAVGTRFLDKAWKISRDIGQDLTEVERKGDKLQNDTLWCI